MQLYTDLWNQQRINRVLIWQGHGFSNQLYDSPNCALHVGCGLPAPTGEDRFR